MDEDEQEAYFFHVLQTELPYSLLGEQSLWKLTPPEINDLMKGLDAHNTLREKTSNDGSSGNHRQQGDLSKSDLKAVEKVQGMDME